MRRASRPNRFAAKCRACKRPVRIGEGIATQDDGRWVVTCNECVEQGANDYPPMLPVSVEVLLSNALSSDPYDFVVWLNGKWVVALDYGWARILGDHVDAQGKKP